MICVIGVMGCLVAIGIVVGLGLGATGLYFQHEANEDAADSRNKMEKAQKNANFKSENAAKAQTKLQKRIQQENEKKLAQQIASAAAYENRMANWATLDKQAVVMEGLEGRGAGIPRNGYNRGAPVSDV